MILLKTKIKNLNLLLKEAVTLGHLLFSEHSLLRLKERKILKTEVEFILKNGFHEKRKDKFNEKFNDWDYSIRGRTLDGRTLRVIIAVIKPNIFVVTAIELNEKKDKN